MKLKSKFLYLICYCALASASIYLAGCGVYSFTGTNINYDLVNTITIKRIENLSGNGPAVISQVFTEGLRDYYQQNTRLTVLTDDEDGDLYLEGEITGYRTAPSTPQSSSNRDGLDLASQTRLTITVRVSFINTTNEEEDFERTFSFYADFDSNQPLNAVEAGLVDEISEAIILDIFNATVANW